MSYRQKSIEIAKEIAKIRDGYVCQRCGKSRSEVKIDAAHIIPVSARGIICADPENIIALCAYNCHKFSGDSWHEAPLEQQWFDIKFPGLYNKLKAKHIIRPVKEWEWKEIYISLKERLKGMNEI